MKKSEDAEELKIEHLNLSGKLSIPWSGKSEPKHKIQNSVETPSRNSSQKKKGTLYVESENELKNYYRIDSLLKEDSVKNEQMNLTDEMKIMHQIIQKLSPEKRVDKAARHFLDAMYLRKIRNDLDEDCSRFLKIAFAVQTNPTWASLLFLLSWLYLAIAIIEPSCATDANYISSWKYPLRPAYIAIEGVVLFFYLMDLFLAIYHRSHEHFKNCKTHILHNKILIIKFIVNCLFVSDYIVTSVIFPVIPLRYSRFFRPVTLFFYNNQLRRTFEGIIQSLRNIIDLLLFYIIFAAVWAAIGVRLIGDLQDIGVGQDPYESNFSNFGIAFHLMYVLLSCEGYPQVMLPALNVSYIYALFFIPYILFSVTLLIPIPIAVLFDGFRTQRSKTIIHDRLNEREALFACFVSIDFERNMVVSRQNFVTLLGRLFNSANTQEKINEIYNLLDFDGNGFVELDEFFRIPEMMLSNKSFTTFTRTVFPPWEWFKNTCNRYLRINKIAESLWFQNLMMLVVILNVVVLIILLSTDSDSLSNTMESIDNALIWVYVAEVGIKWVGLGIRNYFMDNWNKMDFVVTVLSVISASALSSGRIATKGLRAARINRTLRLVRLNRTFAMLGHCHKRMKSKGLPIRILAISFSSLERVKKFFNKMIAVLPTVIKLCVITIACMYVYSIAAMELFNSQFAIPGTTPSIYMPDPYTSFDEITFSFLSFTQFIADQVWTDIVNDIAVRFNFSFLTIAFYFDSFYTVNKFILLSLIEGMVWEVFLVIDKNIQEQEKLTKYLEEADKLPAKKIKASASIEEAAIQGLVESAKNFVVDEDFTTKLATKKIQDRRYSVDHTNLTKNVLENYLLQNLKGSKPPQAGSHNRNSSTDGLINSNDKTFASPINKDVSKISEENSDQKSNESGTITERSGIIDECARDEQYDIAPSPLDRSENNPQALLKYEFKPIAVNKPFREEFLDLSGTQHQHNSQIKSPDASYDREGNKNLTNGFHKSEAENNLRKTLSYKMGAEIIDNPNKEPKLKKRRSFNDNVEGQIKNQGSTEIEFSFRNILSPQKKSNNQTLKRVPGMRGSNRKTTFTTDEINSIKKHLDAADSILSGITHIPEEKNFYQAKLKLLETLNTAKKRDRLDMDGESPESLSVYISAYRVIKQNDSNPQNQQDLELEQKRQSILKSNFNEDFLLRKAMLRNTDMAQVQKFEEDYLTNMYGDYYSKLKQTRPTAPLYGLYDLENRVTVQLMRITRTTKVPLKPFLETIYNIEDTISSQLMQRGGFMKIIFQAGNGRWFTLSSRSNNQLSYQYVSNGPWNYFNEVFPEKNKVYAGSRIISPNKPKKLEDFISRLQSSLEMCSGALSDDGFRSLKNTQSVWNFFAIPFENRAENKAAKLLFELHAKKKGFNLLKLYKYCVKRFLVVSLVLTEESKSQEKPKRFSSANTNNIEKEIEENQPHLSRIDSQIFEKEDEELAHLIGSAKKEQTKHEFLPLEEYVEFLNDLADVLSKYQGVLLAKISEFYAQNTIS